MKLPITIKNTKEQGSFTVFAYPEKKKFVAVCLHFNIVEEAGSIEEALKSVEEASILHLEVVIKKNLSDDLLNRLAPKKYWNKYISICQARVTELKRGNITARANDAVRDRHYSPGHYLYA